MRKRLLLTLFLFIAVPVVTLAAHFQDSNGLVIIRSVTEEFRCPSSEFTLYEPTYEAPPDGAIRIWTDDVQCLQKDGRQYADPFYTVAKFVYVINHIADYQEASVDVTIDGNDFLTGFTGPADYYTFEMQTLLAATDNGELLHDSGEAWFIVDETGGYTSKGYTFRLRTESEFNTTDTYLSWQDAQRDEFIKNIPWKGVITLDANGEFTWQHNLNFTQYIVLISPYGQSMPNLYVSATANSVSILGGIAGGNVIYRIELNLR
jgi:hypothetical protein